MLTKKKGGQAIYLIKKIGGPQCNVNNVGWINRAISYDIHCVLYRHLIISSYIHVHNVV